MCVIDGVEEKENDTEKYVVESEIRRTKVRWPTQPEEATTTPGEENDDDSRDCRDISLVVRRSLLCVVCLCNSN